MIRLYLRLGMWIAAANAVLIALLATKPLSTARSIAIYVVLLTAIALRELVRSLDLRHQPKSRFELELVERRAPAAETSVFAGMERELDLATSSADHLHRRVIPLLRAATAARLAMRHGIELERRPDLARQLLDEPTWDLLRPDRPEPANRHAAGLTRAEIAAAVTVIEAV